MPGHEKFRDRNEAGRRLAEDLREYAGRDDIVVLALPRGGVPVGYEVARRLGAPLDVFLVRKLGVPGHEELAMGAIASGGIRVINEDVTARLRIPDEDIARVAADEQNEIERQERAYRGNRPEPQLEGKTAILVDDGVATGSSMRAAAAALRARDPDSVVVAVPVAAAETCDSFRDQVDEVVCSITPEPFRAVSLWYEDFTQVGDGEVRDILDRAWRGEWGEI